MKILLLILYFFALRPVNANAATDAADAGINAALATHGPPGSNHIRGFNFVQCRQDRCVRVISPEASISIISNGFSTRGSTQLQVLDGKGSLITAHVGTRAVYNPSLDMITLEDDVGGLVMYTPSKNQLTVYSPLAASGVSR